MQTRTYTNEDKTTAEHFAAMDQFLTDPANIEPKLTVVAGSWVMDWSDTPFEAAVVDLFGSATLPTAWTWHTGKRDVVERIRAGAVQRNAKAAREFKALRFGQS